MIRVMPAAKPNVFNIPASVPFLPVLIDALRAGKLVPGFPAARERSSGARHALSADAARLPAGARGVPRPARHGMPPSCRASSPLGDLDEDEIAFAEAATAELAEAALCIASAIAPLGTPAAAGRADPAWANSPEVRGAAGAALIANTPSAALALADDLARLIDDIMTTRQVSWDRLDDPGAGRSRSLLAAVAALSQDRARLAGARHERAIEAR
jgi:ATP-dependent helicase/nuclease subunit B